MYYSTLNYTPQNYFEIQETMKAYKTLEEALILIKEWLKSEKEEVLFYDYLIAVAPTKEEKNIIVSIRDDERKHYSYFKEIYTFFTRKNISPPNNIDFIKPHSYIEGIRKAKFNELSSVEKCRDIIAGVTDKYYKAIIFEILADELNHSHKYTSILFLNLQNHYTNYTKLGEESKTYLSVKQDFYRQIYEFTLTELAKYDGAMGRPAYVAVNGIVYDVSNEATWGGASHFGLMAGKDLTAQFQSCHGTENILSKLPKVGILKI